MAQEDDGNQTSVSAPLNVVVAPVMGRLPGLEPLGAGHEDNDIPLASAAFSGLPDGDGSEQIVSYTFNLNGMIAAAQIGGVVPDVNTLIASHVTGTFTNNGDGTITVLAANLAGVALRKEAFLNANVDFSIPVTARVSEAGGLFQNVNGSYAVNLVGDADIPTAFAGNVTAVTGQLTAINPTGAEFGGAITDSDVGLGRANSERIYYIVSGPAGVLGTDIAFFRPGGQLAGLNNNDGTWYLTPADLSTADLRLVALRLHRLGHPDADLGDSRERRRPRDRGRAGELHRHLHAGPDGLGRRHHAAHAHDLDHADHHGRGRQRAILGHGQPGARRPSPTTPTVSLFISNLPAGAQITGATLNRTPGATSPPRTTSIQARCASSLRRTTPARCRSRSRLWR